MIIKIQWPLGGDVDHVLIYDKPRLFQQVFPVSWFAELYDPDKPKRYFDAEIVEEILNINDEVFNQDW